MQTELLKSMMECLATKAKAELDGNIENVDAKEMGEVVDMIKDIAEAKYYCKIVDEMEEAKEEEEVLDKVGIQPEMARYYGGYRHYYDPMIHGNPYDRYYGDSRYYRPNRVYMTDGVRMYDGGSMNNVSNMGGSRMYNDNRYSNGQYAPDGNTMRTYDINYPVMYDPANIFSQNKWRLGKKGSPVLESKFDKSYRYYQEAKSEHDKGNETVKNNL